MKKFNDEIRKIRLTEERMVMFIGSEESKAFYCAMHTNLISSARKIAFKEDCAAVRVPDPSKGIGLITRYKSYFIDRTGKVISPEYEDAEMFVNGYAIVANSEHACTYVDRNFNYVFENEETGKIMWFGSCKSFIHRALATGGKTEKLYAIVRLTSGSIELYMDEDGAIYYSEDVWLGKENCDSSKVKRR